ARPRSRVPHAFFTALCRAVISTLSLHDALPICPTSQPPKQAVVQTHCHEHSVFGPEVQRNVLRTWGVEDISESSSCCGVAGNFRSEEHTSELQSRFDLVCRLLLEKKKPTTTRSL